MTSHFPFLTRLQKSSQLSRHTLLHRNDRDANFIVSSRNDLLISYHSLHISESWIIMFWLLT